MLFESGHVCKIKQKKFQFPYVRTRFKFTNEFHKVYNNRNILLRQLFLLGFQCCGFWCEECISPHNLIRANREHRVLAIKDFQDQDIEDVLKRPVFCQIKRHENSMKDPTIAKYLNYQYAINFYASLIMSHLTEPTRFWGGQMPGSWDVQ